MKKLICWFKGHKWSEIQCDDLRKYICEVVYYIKCEVRCRNCHQKRHSEKLY